MIYVANTLSAQVLYTNQKVRPVLRKVYINYVALRLPKGINILSSIVKLNTDKTKYKGVQKADHTNKV